jgi:hypothetical protein
MASIDSSDENKLSFTRSAVGRVALAALASRKEPICPEIILLTR